MEKWSLMDDFFRLPWFSRVWTLQELALNLKDATFCCGDQTIEWSTMVKAWDGMKASICDHFFSLDNAMGPYLNLHYDLRWWRSAWTADFDVSDHWLKFERPTGIRPQLSNILSMVRNRQCHDPKDKIFGVFGICQLLDVGMPEPDYQKDLEQIFFEVTSAIIYAEDDLSVLYKVPGPARNHHLPSWVPDWEHGWTYTYAEPLTVLEGYSAGGESNPDLVNIDHGLRILKVHGKVVDVISHHRKSIPVMEKLPISAVLGVLSKDIDTLELLWASWAGFREWVQLVRQQFAEYTDAVEIFLNTILQGNTSASLRLESYGCNLEAAFGSWYSALVETQEMMDNEDGQENKDMWNRIWCVRHVPGYARGDRGIFAFHCHAWSYSGGRSFFTTASSRMGTCQGEVLGGDLVAVVPGSALPLILRQAGKKYSLVGHAYVHEIMHGEAWNNAEYKRKIISIT
jgi:hypothetical protein